MERLFIYLTNLSSNIAYLIIFGILIACGIGFPLPEDIPLIASGYLCWDGTMELIPTLFITMLGVGAGDTILFYLGRRMGLRLLQTGRVQALFRPEKIRRTRAYFRKYGEKIVFFARFVAGFRAVAFFLAGTMKMRFRRFIFFDMMAAALSVPLWIAIGYGLGYYLGDEINRILKGMKNVKTGITALVFTALAVFVIRTAVRYHRAKRSQRDLRNRSAGRAVSTKG